MQPFTFTLELQTYVRGLFVVQPKPDAEEFSRLIEASGAFWPSLCADCRKDYEQYMHVKGYCSFLDTQTPWLILVFGNDRRTVLSWGVHEIVHLADRLTTDKENRARLVQYAYMAFADRAEQHFGVA